MSILGVGVRAAEGSQTRRPCLDAAVSPPRSWDDDKKCFEMWDEDTAGTFSNLGFQDDRHCECCLLGKWGRGFPGYHSSLGRTG